MKIEDFRIRESKGYFFIERKKIIKTIIKKKRFWRKEVFKMVEKWVAISENGSYTVVIFHPLFTEPPLKPFKTLKKAKKYIKKICKEDVIHLMDERPDFKNFITEK